MNSKQLGRIVNDIVRPFDRKTALTVAAIGYKGTLPAEVESDDEEEVRNAVQDHCKCVEAGAFSLSSDR